MCFKSVDTFDPNDWVEFYNRSANTVDLSGWRFTDVDDEAHAFIFPEGTLLETNKYIIVCRHLHLFTALYPQAEPVLSELGFGLSGGGEAILVYDEQNTLVDSLFYDDKSPWPSEADGRGATLELIDPSFDNETFENWKDSDEIGGSPGRPNNPRRGYLVINEFMAQNTSALAGPQGEFSDWIELYNLGSERLGLSGLYLTDDLDRPTRWELPDTTLTAGAYLIIWAQSDSQNTTPMQTNFRLSKDGEQIGLFDRDSWHNAPLGTLSFGVQQNDVPTGRWPNGTGAFRTLAQPTPNAQNNRLSSDFDANGTVDFTDFVMFAAHYGSSAEDARFDARYDLDQSGVVDFSDFLSFAQSFGN